MEPETTPRKEILHINGLTILVILALVADSLIVGFIYRWHNWELFTSNKAQQIESTALLAAERDVKNEIVILENVPAWNDTQYFHLRGN